MTSIINLPRSFEVKGPQHLQRTPGGDMERCVSCNEQLQDTRGSLCAGCSDRCSRETLLPIWSLMTLSGFLLLVLMVEYLPSEGLRDWRLLSSIPFGYTTTLVILMVAASVMLLSLISIRSMFSKESLIIGGSMASISMMAYSIVLLAVFQNGFISIFTILLILAVSLGLAFVCRDHLRSLGTLGVLMLSAGFVLSEMGAYSLLSGKHLPGYLWFMGGEYLLLIGLSILLIITFLLPKGLSGQSRSTASVLTFCLSSSGMLLMIVSLRTGASERSGPFDMAFFTFALLLLVSFSFNARRLLNESIMWDVETEVEKALKKSELLEKSGDLFYALQLVDHALRSNPIYALGANSQANGPFQRIGDQIDEASKEPAPSAYELAFNEKGKILSTKGKLAEAMKQYLEAIRRNPSFLEPYINLSFLLASTPGKRNEGEKYQAYFLGAKRIFLKRLIGPGMSLGYVAWIDRCFDLYKTTIRRKNDLLAKISREGDILGYYSITKY